jgi:DNA-binding PadR family transcriptional regulator
MEVLLGLLTVSPMSGYDLGQSIRTSVGFFWTESYGQIYPNLKRLAAGGFVSSKLERQKGKPDRHIYSITKKGRERLTAWMAVKPQPEIARNELLLKLFFGLQVAPETLIGFVEEMAQRERSYALKFKQIEKQLLAQEEQYPDLPYWIMTARFGQLELDAHLRWAEETLAELKKLATKKRVHTDTRKEKKHAGR